MLESGRCTGNRIFVPAPVLACTSFDAGRLGGQGVVPPSPGGRAPHRASGTLGVRLTVAGGRAREGCDEAVRSPRIRPSAPGQIWATIGSAESLPPLGEPLMATGTNDPAPPASPAEGAAVKEAEGNVVQRAKAAETKAADAERRAKEAEAKAADAESRAKEAEAKLNELSPEERVEQAKRDTRRSAVRVRVTYLAAGFLFVAGAAIVGYLLVVGQTAKATDLFLAILPVSAAIVTYWFATRRGGAVSMDEIAKVIEAAKRQS